MNKRTIGILGSTGSIGKKTIEILKLHPEKFEIVFLTSNNNYQELANQAKILKPKMVAIANQEHYLELKKLLSGESVEIYAGEQAIIDVATVRCDMVVAALVGAVGLAPTIAAIEAGSDIALANKECLVCAGKIVMSKIVEHNVRIIPIDSEHNAIMQVFDYQNPQSISKIILTASGGPFLNTSIEQMRAASVEQALSHPNWKMGNKITIDSATMFNKGFEMIEAYHLFPVNFNQVDIIVHPQSIIHSMVCYNNGSILAQLGKHDMIIPISIALFWPEKIDLPNSLLDFNTIKSLDFRQPDEIKFPAIRITKEAIQAGGNATAIINGANEVAVAQFLKGTIKFMDIPNIVEEVLNDAEIVELNSITDVIESDIMARSYAKNCIKNLQFVSG